MPQQSSVSFDLITDVPWRNRISSLFRKGAKQKRGRQGQAAAIPRDLAVATWIKFCAIEAVRLPTAPEAAPADAPGALRRGLPVNNSQVFGDVAAGLEPAHGLAVRSPISDSDQSCARAPARPEKMRPAVSPSHACSAWRFFFFFFFFFFAAPGLHQRENQRKPSSMVSCMTLRAPSEAGSNGLGEALSSPLFTSLNLTPSLSSEPAHLRAIGRGRPPSR